MTRDVAHADPLTEPLDSAPARSRLLVVDKLRGLVIVLMILDHTRHFFHRDGLLFSPTDVDKTYALLFATRWVTHLCAPTFVFLAGVSVYLQRENGKRGWPLSRFLLARGLWLVFLEASVVSFGFGFSEPFLFLQVIWAIGCSFILLSTLVAAPAALVLGLGLVLVGGHDLLDSVAAPVHQPWLLGWTLMLKPGLVGVAPGFVAYPALPWFGIMAVGYGVGGVFLSPPGHRNRILVASGLGMLAAFAVLRGLDVYGDPKPWTVQPDVIRTVLAFMNVTKYPPSLLYVLATLGVVLTLAPLVEWIGGKLGRLFHVFGRTPLFTYLVHIYVVHGLAVLIGVAMGVPLALFVGSFAGASRLAAAGWGFGLGGVYLVWVAVVLALWPLSAWFGQVKERRRTWWRSYL